MALPFASEHFEVVWLLVAAFFLFFSLPAFMVLPEDKRTGMSVAAAARWGLTSFREIVSEVWRVTELRRFLLAFFFFIDGVLTIIVMAAAVATQTFGFGDQEAIILFLIVQFSALIGAFAMARPTDKLGPKRVLNGVLILWVVVSLSALFIQTQTSFFALAIVAGFGLGSVQSASRAFFSMLVPGGRESEMFGFYALCGRSSSVLGPFLFGTVTLLAEGNQRPSFLVPLTLFVLGLFLLQRVKDPRVDQVQVHRLSPRKSQ